MRFDVPKQVAITTLEEALAEIERLRHMLSVVQVVRVEMTPPQIENGDYSFKPVFTAVGVSEERLVEEVAKQVGVFFLEALAIAQELEQEKGVQR